MIKIKKLLFYYFGQQCLLFLSLGQKGPRTILDTSNNSLYVCSISDSLIRCEVCLSICIMLRVYTMQCVHCIVSAYPVKSIGDTIRS